MQKDKNQEYFSCFLLVRAKRHFSWLGTQLFKALGKLVAVLVIHWIIVTHRKCQGFIAENIMPAKRKMLQGTKWSNGRSISEPIPPGTDTCCPGINWCLSKRRLFLEVPKLYRFLQVMDPISLRKVFRDLGLQGFAQRRQELLFLLNSDIASNGDVWDHLMDNSFAPIKNKNQRSTFYSVSTHGDVILWAACLLVIVFKKNYEEVLSCKRIFITYLKIWAKLALVDKNLGGIVKIHINLKLV